MFDAKILDANAHVSDDALRSPTSPKSHAQPSRFFMTVKRLSDFLAAALLLPITLVAALVLLVLNPIFNQGPLLFRQSRMGKDCKLFTAYKFRTMTEAAPVKRGAFDALEENRITKLGRLMRKTRVDELPQILNIVKGDMSLVGPRPDFIDHARVYVDCIPGYRDRHSVRPGVTGLAQTEVGYVSDEAGFRRKVAADMMYIRKMSFTTDLKIFARTIMIVFGQRGR